LKRLRISADSIFGGTTDVLIQTTELDRLIREKFSAPAESPVPLLQNNPIAGDTADATTGPDPIPACSQAVLQSTPAGPEPIALTQSEDRKGIEPLEDSKKEVDPGVLTESARHLRNVSPTPIPSRKGTDSQEIKRLRKIKKKVDPMASTSARVYPFYGCLKPLNATTGRWRALFCFWGLPEWARRCLPNRFITTPAARASSRGRMPTSIMSADEGICPRRLDGVFQRFNRS